jgi:tripartite-type tricarboxylate transporter receptor subunit TctC
VLNRFKLAFAKESTMLKLPRRRFLHLTASAVALAGLSRVASAQAYTSRPVKLLVGYAAGGAADILARLMGQWLSERFGQPFVVENRTGAGSNIAAEALVRSPPDGYTLFLAASANAINSTLYENLSFNFSRDISPAAVITREPIVLQVGPSFPAKTVPEFIAYAKDNPGKLSMASPGTGSMPHVAGELFKIMTGVDMVHVPYRGGAPALTDLIAGQVQVLFLGPAASMEHIKSGNVRALAVTSDARVTALPNVPTVGETVPGYEASQWFGIVAPKNTPADIVNKLNIEINAGLADPKLKSRLLDLGGTVAAASPIEFGQRIIEDADKWAKVIRVTNMKAT